MDLTTPSPHINLHGCFYGSMCLVVLCQANLTIPGAKLILYVKIMNNVCCLHDELDHAESKTVLFSQSVWVRLWKRGKKQYNFKMMKKCTLMILTLKEQPWVFFTFQQSLHSKDVCHRRAVPMKSHFIHSAPPVCCKMPLFSS